VTQYGALIDVRAQRELRRGGGHETANWAVHETANWAVYIHMKAEQINNIDNELDAK